MIVLQDLEGNLRWLSIVLSFVVTFLLKEQRAANETTSDASDVLRPIGQVFELCCDGQMVIQWDDGTRSCCYPMQLYLVGDEVR